jgi:hypothetical protein
MTRGLASGIRPVGLGSQIADCRAAEGSSGGGGVVFATIRLASVLGEG